MDKIPPIPGIDPNWGNCVVGGADGVATIGKNFQCLLVPIGNIIMTAYYFAGAAAIVMVIISGMKFIDSAGNPQKLDAARKTLIFSIIGLIIIILAGGVIYFIGSIALKDANGHPLNNPDVLFNLHLPGT